MRNPAEEESISYGLFNNRFREWLDGLDLGGNVAHQARHTLATKLLAAGASLAHIRKYLGHLTPRTPKAACAEISSQRDQIGKLLGRIRDLEIDLPADAVERINAENRTLRLQNRKLTTGNQQLTERIKAARENNRFLDTRIARLEADLAESLLAGQRAPAQPS